MQDAKRNRRSKALGAFISLTLVVSTAVVFVTFTSVASATGLKALKSAVAASSGATLPYVEMEAHSATTNGTVLGPDYQLGDLASDGVDRTVVQLTQGQSVQFTLPQAANSI